MHRLQASARTARAAILSLIAVGIVASACTSAPTRPHVSLSGSAEPLRSQFNQDAGRLRILIIAAPT